MSVCEQLAANASAGVAPALRAVDCLAGETTTSAFARLFGGQGALAPALTILLTLYIAFFAVSLLTGRSRIGISALTPRMMTLGLVLTFATSWIAYQSVVWNLAVGAPDQIASALTGAKGSATQIFADRIDIVFAAVADAAGSAAPATPQGVPAAAAGSFQPGDLMWLGALVLLLGTVGILVTARIALAVLLALGPVFVVMALFGGTRGLFAGWLRGVVMTATTPLFVVVGGGLSLELLVPVVAGLRASDGAGINGSAALALFMIAAVHMALMVMLMKVSATMVSSWSVFGLANKRDAESASATVAGQAIPAAVHAVAGDQTQPFAPRRAAVVMPSTNQAIAISTTGMPGSSQPAAARSTVIFAGLGETQSPQQRSSTPRARGVGSRFRSRAAQPIREYAR